MQSYFQQSMTETYPHTNIALITGAPGGGIDFAARLLAAALSKRLGAAVSVTNAPAHTMAEVVAAAAPDGATLLMTGKILWLAPYLHGTVNYDPVADFEPITIAVRSPNILVVNPKLPANSVAELIALAKAQPAKLTFTSSGAGSSTYLASELLSELSGIVITHVPRIGNKGAVRAVAAGEVDFMFSGVTAAQPLIKGGALRALALASAAPSQLFPGMPTVSQTVPGYESESILCLYAPAKTPKPLIKQMNAAILECLRDPDVRSGLLSADLEAAGSTPEELAGVMKAEMERLGTMLRRR